MLYVFFAVLLMVVFYLGQVIGLMIHCELCSDFRELKRYLYAVPFIRIAMFFFCLYDCIKDRNLKLFIAYIFCPDKNIMIICSLVECLPELKKLQSQRKRRVRRELQTSPLDTLRAVLFGTQDIFESGFQVM